MSRSVVTVTSARKVVFRFVSRACALPSAISSRISASIRPTGFDRSLPRIDGIVQNAHFWLHPSLTRRYAQWRGVRRRRLESSSK